MYLGYLIFTSIMTIGATETNEVLFATFVMIDFLFIALLSLYGAGAHVLNKYFGFNFLPIGKPFVIFSRDAFEKKEKTVKA